MGLIGQSRPSIVLRHLKLFRIPMFEQPSNGGRVNDSTNLTILADGESESTAAAHATWRGRHRGTRAADLALRVLRCSLCAEMRSVPSQGMLFEQQMQLVLLRRRIVAQRMLHAADHADLQCARHLRANGGDFAAHQRLLFVAQPKLLLMRTQRGLILLKSPFTEHAEIPRRVFIGPLHKSRLRDSRPGNYVLAGGTGGPPRGRLRNSVHQTRNAPAVSAAIRAMTQTTVGISNGTTSKCIGELPRRGSLKSIKRGPLSGGE